MATKNILTKSVDDSASAVVLLAAREGVKERIIQNDSSSILYIKFDAPPSTTDYTIKLFTDDILITEYQGGIYGIWSANSTGAARITERR